MALPPILPMHPVDVFYGVVVPQVQTYMAAAPRFDLDEELAKARIGALIEERFGRMAYHFPETLGVITTMRLAEDIGDAVTVLSLDELEAMDADALEHSRGDRRWRMFIAQGSEITLVLLVFDHLLSHGFTGRGFLYAALDALRPEPDAPPALNQAQQAQFRAYQDHIGRAFLDRAPWATHKRMCFPSAPLQALAKVLGQPFTEAAMLWVARSILDVSERGWPIDASIFRMEPGGDPATWTQPGIGNMGLQLDTWEILPQGAYSAGQPPFGDDPEGAERFVRFYQGFPFKLPLAWTMKALIGAARKRDLKAERERLVINNLGHTRYPFFRTMFFDPVNEVDRFGLVFVDGVQDRVELQLSPPAMFLEHFDQPAFEARLAANLEGMLADPRLRRIEA